MATLLAPSRTDRAFERLYRRHVADVYRYVLAVLQNEADAEDATQTAFLSAYRAYERGERPELARNWLIAIAHNVCRQRFRESARRPRLVELDDDVAARASDDETPNADEIRRALGFLAFNQRAALVLRELQGCSYDEIAAMLGLSVSAVETLLFRARRALREQLEGALTCAEAERALSKRADGELSFAERGQLRAHVRECADCAILERGQRFRRRALRTLGVAPVPSSLASFFGGGAIGTGVGVGAKAAAVVAAGVLGTGLAGDAIRDQTAAQNKSATDAQPRSASVQQHSAFVHQHAQVLQARVAERSRFRRAAPARRRLSAQTGAAARSGAAPDVTQPASTPPFAGGDPASSVSPPGPVDEAQAPAPVPAVPDLPSLPSLPATPPPGEPPPPPELPLPELVQPVVPPPELPKLPALPELPRVTLPELPRVTLPTTVELPQTPRIDLPPTEKVGRP